MTGDNLAQSKQLRSAWNNMKYRCYGGRNGARTEKHYKAKGITVCDEWKDCFEAFLCWAVANGYKPGLTIDRIDSNGNYCPENCRWISRDENARRAVVKTDGRHKNGLFRCRKNAGQTMDDVAKHLGVSKAAVSQWENAVYFPTADKLLKIAAFYGCTVDALLKPDND